MEKDNKYYGIIENLIRNHRKFNGYEAIIDDIIDDVYSHSEVILSTVDNESVITSYLAKVVSTSIITVPKRMNFHADIKHKVIAERTLSVVDEIKEPINEPILENLIDNSDESNLLENEESANIDMETVELPIEENIEDDNNISSGVDLSFETEEIPTVDNYESVSDDGSEDTDLNIKAADVPVNTYYVDQMINNVEPSFDEKEDADEDEELFTALSNEVVYEETEQNENDVNIDVQNAAYDDFSDDEVFDSDNQDGLKEDNIDYDDIQNEYSDEIENVSEDVEEKYEELDTEQAEQAEQVEKDDEVVLVVDDESINTINDETQDLEDDAVILETVEDNAADESDSGMYDITNDSDALEISDDSDSDQIVEEDYEIQDSSEELDIAEETTDNYNADENGEQDAEITDFNIDDTPITLEISDDESAIESDLDITTDDNISELEVSDENTEILTDESIVDSIVEPNADTSEELTPENDEVVIEDFYDDTGINDEISLVSDSAGELQEFVKNEDVLSDSDNEKEDEDSIEESNETVNLLIDENTPEVYQTENNETTGSKLNAIFDFSQNISESVDSNDIAERLQNLDDANPGLNILQIYDLKYNKKAKIYEIANALDMDADSIIKALNIMVSVV